MGVGYSSETIFAMSSQDKSLMEGNKLYVSNDLAKTWQEVEAKGLEDQLLIVADHPKDGNLIAAVGQKGIYLSEDKGEKF